MDLKRAEYPTSRGILVLFYDPNAPCIYCEQPVGEASMGGTVVCPSCDCGYNRDGTRWTGEQAMKYLANASRHLK